MKNCKISQFITNIYWIPLSLLFFVFCKSDVTVLRRSSTHRLKTFNCHYIQLMLFTCNLHQTLIRQKCKEDQRFWKWSQSHEVQRNVSPLTTWEQTLTEWRGRGGVGWGVTQLPWQRGKRAITHKHGSLMYRSRPPHHGAQPLYFPHWQVIPDWHKSIKIPAHWSPTVPRTTQVEYINITVYAVGVSPLLFRLGGVGASHRWPATSLKITNKARSSYLTLTSTSVSGTGRQL